MPESGPLQLKMVHHPCLAIAKPDEICWQKTRRMASYKDFRRVPRSIGRRRYEKKTYVKNPQRRRRKSEPWSSNAFEAGEPGHRPPPHPEGAHPVRGGAASGFFEAPGGRFASERGKYLPPLVRGGRKDLHRKRWAAGLTRRALVLVEDDVHHGRSCGARHFR